MIITVTLNCAVDRIVQVEDLVLDQINRGACLSSLPGGKGLNVARALKTLNEPVTAWGFVGGKNGEFICEKLEEEGILSDFIGIEAESRICTTYLDPVQETLTEVNEAGPVIPLSAVQLFYQKLDTLNFTPDAIAFSGSLPQGVPEQIYGRLLELVPDKTTFTVLDAKGLALRGGLREKPDLVKPNRREAEDLWGFPLNGLPAVHKAIDRFLETGVRMVALSLDKEGAIVADQNERWQVQAPPIKAVNTVGSGDAFVAGFLKGLLTYGKLDDAARLGVACGSANALVLGAGKFHLEDAQAFMEEIQAVLL